MVEVANRMQVQLMRPVSGFSDFRTVCRKCFVKEGEFYKFCRVVMAGGVSFFVLNQME